VSAGVWADRRLKARAPHRRPEAPPQASPESAEGRVVTEHEINAWFLRTHGLFVFLDDIQEAIEAEAPPCEGCDEALLAIRPSCRASAAT
jgi:hypothetical protein